MSGRRAVGLLLLAVIGLTASLPSTPSTTNKDQPKPHIVLIVADDLGWNDVSWHNPQVLTPHLEELARDGVLLEQSYVQPICTPTRSALMTGRYPFTVGRQHAVLWPEEPTGLSIKRELLPQALKNAGYSTHAVGKWHLGFCSWDYTPTSRGFDTFWGYYTGAEDYYYHTRTTWHPGDHLTEYPNEEGYDNDTSIKFGYDFRNNTKAEYSVDGEYSTYLFSSYIENLLETRSPSDPMFLYLPFQSVHAPLQVPENYTDPFAHIKHHNRRTKFGMVLAMDEAVGRVVEALKNSGHYNNSIIVFTTDNGGPTVAAGNNWPLRGNKTTLWEGGTRGAAFVHSPLLPQKGIVSNKLIHVTDWFSTLVGLGGGVAPEDTNGYDQWKAITTSAPSPRKEMVYNIDITEQVNAGIRMGDYKLLVGDPGPGEWTPPPEGNQTSFHRDSFIDLDVMEIHLPDYNKTTINQDSFVDPETMENYPPKDNQTIIQRNSLDDQEMMESHHPDYNENTIHQDSSDELEEMENQRDMVESELSSESGQRILVDKEKPRFSRLNNFLQSKKLNIGRFVITADLSSDDEELKSMDVDPFEKVQEEISDGEKETGSLKRTPIEKENNQVLDSITSSEDKLNMGEGNDLVTVRDLGLDITQYTKLGQLLSNDTTLRLYNVIGDPNERNNLAAERKDIVKILLGLIQHHLKEYVPPDILPNDPDANPRFWNNTWTPGWCHAK